MSVFSHSRMECFANCPRKYAFSYVEKAPHGPSGIEAFMGNRVHEALEWLYQEVRACRMPDEETLLARYATSWDAEWSDDVRVVRADRVAADYRAIGEKALRAYHRRYTPFDDGVTIGLELRVSLRLDEEHQIVGYVDRVVKVADGVWEIHDYKTSASLMTQAQADEDRQLALYEIALREMFAEVREVTLVWHYLAFDEEVRSSRSPEQLAALKADVLSRVRAIDGATDFPTTVSRLCDWCDYRAACPAWAHQSAVADLPRDEFADESGVALVDEYMRCAGEVAGLEARRETLRQAIAARAAAGGLERLFGTEFVVSVRRAVDVRLPDVKDPRRPELESALRELGIWDRYAAFSCAALSRDIKEGALPEQEALRIEPFVTRASSVRLSARKLE